SLSPLCGRCGSVS
ncbi:hypothetical protein EC950183_4982, partial [Escherichia coli 95.0183]